MPDINLNDTPGATQDGTGSGLADKPLTDQANPTHELETSEQDPVTDPAAANPNKTETIQQVQTDDATQAAKDQQEKKVLTSEELKVAAAGSAGFVTSATYQAPEANTLDTKSVAGKADRDAMIDRRLALIKRFFGASEVHLSADQQGTEEPTYILVDTAGKEVGRGTMGDLSEQALDSLPDDEPLQDIVVPNVTTHVLNNLDDLEQAVGTFGGKMDREKVGDHYQLTTTLVDTEGKTKVATGKVTVNATKQELTKFFLKIKKELVKAVTDIEKGIAG